MPPTTVIATGPGGMPVSSNVPSLRVTVPAFAGCAVAPPPAASRMIRAHTTGAPVAPSTTVPFSVAPSVTTSSTPRTPSAPVLAGTGTFGAQPLAPATSS